MIKNVKETALPHGSVFRSGWCVVDIETEGRFWRTSKLLKAYAITYGEPCTEYEWIAEKEADEYDILSELSQVLKRSAHFMTFNGNSFDFPHLRKKYQAYRATDPTGGRKSLDLMHALGPYQFMFGLESHHLRDYLTLFGGRYPVKNDAEGALLLSSLLDIARVFALPEADLAAELSVCADGPDSELVICWDLPAPLPIDLVITDEVFRLASSDRTVKLSVLTDGTSLRRYYRDYENYEYLLAEGYAAHKSLTAYVAADRKEKAVRGNCYSLLPLGSVYPDRPDRLRKYVVSILDFMRREISDQ